MMLHRTRTFGIFLGLALYAALNPVIGQDITTEGKDFWFGFMENHETSEIRLEIYISAADSTNGVVTMPLTGWSQTFSVKDNSTVLVTVPTNTAMATGSGLIENKGIHIQTNDNVSVYALNSRSRSADASVILPTPALGRTYFASSYKGTNSSRFSELMVVAVEDNTQVEISPTKTTTDGHSAGSTYSVSLDSGQLVQVQSVDDLTGTKIKSAGSCKPFAVFSGNEWTNVGSCGGAQDHLYEQMFPVGAWGKNFTTVPYKTRLNGDEFKIIASSNQTTVQVGDAAAFILNEGQFSLKNLRSPTIIRSDKPIQVSQFSRSTSCDGQNGDPFMIQLSPIEQSLKKITYNAPNVTVLDSYYTNIITRTDAVSDLLFDDTNIADQFNIYADYPEYSYAQISISIGNHTIESPAGFTAYVYGFGNIESFGYATGARLDNLNMVVSFQNETTGETEGQICRGDELTFEVSTLRSYAHFEWDFGGGVIKTGNIVSHIFLEGGDFFVTVTGKTGSSGACSDQETSVKLIQVLEPNIAVLGPRSVCPFSSGVEYLADDDAADNVREWWVEGGSIISGQGSKSIIVDWGDTNDQSGLKLLTMNALGCVGDTTDFPVIINIQLDPSAALGLDSLCSSDISDIAYSVYPTPTSIYNWHVENGEITSENGLNEVTVTWAEPGIGKLWYEESSTLSEICSGISDTLLVVIEKEPDESLDIVLNKSVFQMEETIAFNFAGDENFNFISWDFGDNNGIDSIARQTPVHHFYSCPGTYTVKISAYTETICQNLGFGMREITILEPELEIISVSNSQHRESTLEVVCSFENVNFYSRPIQLEKRMIDPYTTSWALFSTVLGDTILDQTPDVYTSIFEYREKAITACDQEYESFEHNNLRLTSQKDSTGTLQLTVERNSYKNWINGVQFYELWQKIDDGEYKLVGQMPGTSNQIAYENNGFDHCFKVKAVENFGNNTVAWSNETCESYVPEVTTYNIITPNGDGFNEEFVIDGIENYVNNLVTIFDRSGSVVFEKEAYDNHWAGTNKAGKELPTGVYYYYINLNEPRSLQEKIKGIVTVLR